MRIKGIDFLISHNKKKNQHMSLIAFVIVLIAIFITFTNYDNVSNFFSLILSDSKEATFYKKINSQEKLAMKQLKKSKIGNIINFFDWSIFLFLILWLYLCLLALGYNSNLDGIANATDILKMILTNEMQSKEIFHAKDHEKIVTKKQLFECFLKYFKVWETKILFF